jgi:hypothetical protein
MASRVAITTLRAVVQQACSIQSVKWPNSGFFKSEPASRLGRRHACRYLLQSPDLFHLRSIGKSPFLGRFHPYTYPKKGEILHFNVFISIHQVSSSLPTNQTGCQALDGPCLSRYVLSRLNIDFIILTICQFVSQKCRYRFGKLRSDVRVCTLVTPHIQT